MSTNLVRYAGADGPAWGAVRGTTVVPLPAEYISVADVLGDGAKVAQSDPRILGLALDAAVTAIADHARIVAELQQKAADLATGYIDACHRATEAEASLAACRADAERLDYIERTFSGMTNRERYLPVQMIWGKGCNGRTLREACDKYMKRDAARSQP